MSARSLRRYAERPAAAARLVIFPHAGAAAHAYRPLALRLPDTVDAVAIQYPGRLERFHEPLVGDAELLADDIVGDVLPLADRPLFVLGVSMGAAIGFEVARRLARAGRPAAGFFAVSRPAPSRVVDGGVHRRTDAELVAVLRGLRGTDSELLDDPGMLEMIMPIVRNDFRVAETHRRPPGPDLDCPVHVLVGTHDPKTTVPDATAWREHTTGPCETRVLDGGHFLADSHLDEVATHVTDRIADHVTTEGQERGAQRGGRAAPVPGV